MTRGNKNDYTKLSWILSRPSTPVAYGITLLIWGLAIATLLAPLGWFPVAPPLIVAGLFISWMGIMTLFSIDSEEVVETMSQTGWMKETTTHTISAWQAEGEQCHEPECDVSLHSEAEIVERYTYDVLRVGGKEIYRQQNTFRRACPEHTNLDAFDPSFKTPELEKEEDNETEKEEIAEMVQSITENKD